MPAWRLRCRLSSGEVFLATVSTFGVQPVTLPNFLLCFNLAWRGLVAWLRRVILNNDSMKYFLAKAALGLGPVLGPLRCKNHITQGQK